MRVPAVPAQGLSPRIAAQAAAIARLREDLAVLASHIADVEDQVAITFDDRALAAPDRAAQLHAQADEARRFALVERARAARYLQSAAGT